MSDRKPPQKIATPPPLGFSECWPSWLLLALFLLKLKKSKKNVFLQKNNLASQQKKLADFYSNLRLESEKFNKTRYSANIFLYY